MRGLVPGIHVLLCGVATKKDVDGQDRPGHDGEGAAMTAKRILYAGLGAVAVLAALLFMLSPIPWFAAWMAYEELFPSQISWDGKTAWKRCESAIAEKTKWPEAAAARCSAMHMCANEANLSEEQVEMLTQAIRETKGCQMP